MASTLNVKGDRKIVCATYICESHFSIPDGLDLNDKTKVEGWGVKWDRLWIKYVDGTEEDINATYEAQEMEDWKRPNKAEIVDPIGDVEEYYPDDEEESDDEDDGEFNPECEICGDYMSDVEEEDYENGCNTVCDNCTDPLSFCPSCEKCDEKVPSKPDDMWVECTCSAHPGWYCGNHSPGNECFDDEECDCCNPNWREEKKEEDDEETLATNLANTLVSRIIAYAVNRAKPCKKNQCIGMTKKKFRCKNTLISPSGMCRTHSPELIG